MKKVMVMLLVVALLAGVFGFTPVRAAQSVIIQITIGSTKAYVNSKETSLDQPPVIENGRTLVPFRFIGEALGAEIGWDPVKKTVSYVLGDMNIILTIGSTTAFVNSIATKLDVAPKILSGRTVVPVRFISETIGAKVDWNSSTKMVTVTGTKPGGGKLVVYSPNSDTLITNVLNVFAQKYNIDVSLQSMGTGEVISKLQAEKNNPQADVMWGGCNLGVYLNNKDLFQKYVAKGDDKLPKAYQNPNGFLTNHVLDGSNLLVNTDLEKALGISIKSYDDLLNPALKGKIASADPTASSSAWAQLCNILLVKGGYESPNAWAFVEDLIKQLDGKLTSGSSAVYKGVSQGEYVVGLTYEDPSVALLQSGAKNLRIVYPSEGAVWLPAAAAIIAGAKNLDNAKLFLDYLISDEDQKRLADLTSCRTVNPKFPNKDPYMLPMSQIKVAYEDIEYTSTHRKEMQAKWTELWAKLYH